jgi:NitT/TauT family transport system permease protein
MIDLITSGIMLEHFMATSGRLFVGLFLGMLPAILLGLMMGWSSRVRSTLDPFIAALHPVPKIAILPLIMVIFGIGEASRLVVIAIASFFPMVINTMTGVRQISPSLFEVAVNYGARRSQIFRRVIVPGSLPMQVSGFRLAFNNALIISVAIELVTARRGLGALIWLAWETFRIEQLYAGLIMISLLGIGVNALIKNLSTYLMPWQDNLIA